MELRAKYGNAAVSADLAERMDCSKEIERRHLANTIVDILHYANALGLEPLYVCSLAVVSFQDDRPAPIEIREEGEPQRAD